MAILAGLKAFLDALDGGGSPSGQQPAAPSPPPVQAPAPMAEVVEALAVRVSVLEAELKGMRSYVDQAAESATRAAERVRSAFRRALERGEVGPVELDPSPDVPGDDGSPGPGQGVRAVPERVEAPAAPNGEIPLDDFLAAARAQVIQGALEGRLR